MPDRQNQNAPRRYRFVPDTSKEAAAIAAGRPQAELSNSDRDQLEAARRALGNVRTGVEYYLTAEDALSRVDEGPITGRFGDLMANMGIGANVSDYETMKRVTGQIANIGLRELGGNDTENEFIRFARQTVNVGKTPEYNTRLIQEAKVFEKLAEDELALMEHWINEYGSLTARSPHGMTLTNATSALRRDARRKRAALREANRGDGWNIAEVPE